MQTEQTVPIVCASGRKLCAAALAGETGGQFGTERTAVLIAYCSPEVSSSRTNPWREQLQAPRPSPHLVTSCTRSWRPSGAARAAPRPLASTHVALPVSHLTRRLSRVGAGLLGGAEAPPPPPLLPAMPLGPG